MIVEEDVGSFALSHAQRIQHSITAGEAALSPLVASWQRCVSVYGLDPAKEPDPQIASAAELTEIFDIAGPILSHSNPTMDRLWSLVKGQSACLLFAGADGVVLRVWNHLSDDDDLVSRGLRPGADWSETVEGTNGIGTCLVESQMQSIHLDQHFFARDAGISCVAAPIFDHCGALAGAVNLTLYGRAAQQMPLGLLMTPVAEAARQIESDHFHHSFSGGHGRARIVALHGHARAGSALVAVDRDGIIIGANRAARQLHALTDEAIKKGISLDMLEGNMETDGLPGAERGTLRRALLRNRGNVSAAARDLGISLATMKRKLRDHGLNRRASSRN